MAAGLAVGGWRWWAAFGDGGGGEGGYKVMLVCVPHSSNMKD